MANGPAPRAAAPAWADPIVAGPSWADPIAANAPPLTDASQNPNAGIAWSEGHAPVTPAPQYGRRIARAAGGAVSAGLDAAKEGLLGVPDAALHEATQLGAWVPAGIAYNLSRLASGVGRMAGANRDRVYRDASGHLIDDADQHAQYVLNATQRGATWAPRTQTGAGISNAIDSVLTLPARLTHGAGALTAEATGSPAAGAAVNTGLNAALMLAGAGKGRVALRSLTDQSPSVGAYARDVKAAWDRTTPAQRILATPATRALPAPPEPPNPGASAALPAPASPPAALPPPQLPPSAPGLPAPNVPEVWGAGKAPPSGPRIPPPPPEARLPLPVRAVRRAQDIGRALTVPLRQNGADEYALQSMLRFGVSPADLANLDAEPTPLGTRPMLAERIGSTSGATGAARLQMMAQQDPAVAGRVNALDDENNAIRANALEALTGRENGELSAAEGRRAGNAVQNYQARAFREDFNPSDLPEPFREQHDTLISRRPIAAAAAAVNRAAEDASPVPIDYDATRSIEGMHRMKTYLDDQIAKADRGVRPDDTFANFSVGALRAARNNLVAHIEQVAPSYRDARLGYQEDSLPINRMTVLGKIADKARATSGIDANNEMQSAISPSRLDAAMSPSGQEAVINAALGRHAGNATRLEQILEPAQHMTLNQIRLEGLRRMRVNRLGLGPGSSTSRNLYAQGLLDALGPIGEHPAVKRVVEGPLNLWRHFAPGSSDAELMQTIGELVSDPAQARTVYMRMLQQANAERAAKGLPPLRPGETP